MRYLLNAPVVFCWVDSYGATHHGEGHTRDVSTKGTRVVSVAPPPVGARVAMNIEIAITSGDLQSHRVAVDGHVVRVEASGIRCCFCLRYDRVVSVQCLHA